MAAAAAAGQRRTYFVGLAGGSGSLKTNVSKAVAASMADGCGVEIIHQR